MPSLTIAQQEFEEALKAVDTISYETRKKLVKGLPCRRDTYRKLKDAGIAVPDNKVLFAGLKGLRRLSLANTDVSDASVEHLKGLVQLESLNLERTKVTDAGLSRLAGLSKLQRLKLQGSGVTKEGVRKLQTLLPNCNITF